MLRVASPTMFSWHGVIVPPEIEAEYKSVIDKLIFGPRRGLNYKKLRGYDNLITVRENGKHRLLFTTVEHFGQTYLNFCGVMQKHKHDRVEEDVLPLTDIDECAFLQPGVLEHFRQANAPMLSAANITKEHLISVTEDECGLPPIVEKREHQVGKTDFNKTKFIILNPNQQNIADAVVHSRVVVMGDAGSGKTCVIMAHLTRNAENRLLSDADMAKPDVIPVKPAVCVVKSARLCAFLKKSWSLSPVGQRYTKGQVRFVTYPELIREQDENASVRKEVSKETFERFITDQIKIKIQQTKYKNKEHLSQHFLKEVDYYQEIRVMAGLVSLEEYQSLGTKQSQVKKEDRPFFFEVCKKYRTYLDDNGLIDFAIYQPKLRPMFSLVVADEAGDYTRSEMKALCSLTENGDILLCFDENQRLDDRKEQLDDYKAELNAKDGKMQPLIRLTHSYRCGRAIATMANQVSTLRYKLTKRKLDPMEVDASVTHAGHVELLTELGAEKLSQLRQLASLPGFAVITLEEHKSAAKKEFNTDEVYTVKEMKGLDCSHIVIYRLMERKEFYEANKALVNGETNEKYIAICNEYYTACTRAMQGLYLYEPAKSKLKNILLELRKGLSAVVSEVITKKYTEEEIQTLLLKELRKHAANGDINKAREVGQDPRLKMTVEQVEQVIKAIAPELPDVSVAQAVKVVERIAPAAISTHKKKKKKKTASKEPASAAAVPSSLTATLFATKAARNNTKVASSVILKQVYTVSELEKIALTSLNTTDLTVTLNDIFIISNASTYLFKTPLFKTGDNLFTLLLDNPVTRYIVLRLILPRHFAVLLPHLTPALLNRGCQGGSASVNKMPPLFWICQCDTTLGLLQQNSEFSKLWKLENLASLTTTVDSHCSLQGTSALHWLGAYQSSLPALAQLVKVGKLGKYLSESQLLTKHKDHTVTEELAFSLFDNLFTGGEIGLSILIDIFDQQHDLARKLKLSHLFPLPEVSNNDLPLLACVRKSANGDILLGRIQYYNPAFAPFILTELKVHECAQMQRVLKPVIRGVAAKREYIAKLLQGFRTQDEKFKLDLFGSLERLLTDSKSLQSWYHYLFNIPLGADQGPECSGESLFYNLMYHHDSRPAMQALMIKYGDIMIPHVTVFALIGIESQHIASPFIWMIHSVTLRELLLLWLKSNSVLAKMCGTEFMLGCTSYDEYQRAGLEQAYESEAGETIALLPGKPVAVYKILAMSATGRQILNLVLKSKLNIKSHDILARLTEDSYVDTATGENYSVLEYATAEASRLSTAFSLLQISSIEANSEAPDEIICKNLYSNNPNKKAIIKNLLMLENGFAILLTLANLGVHSRAQIACYLFSVFFAETTDEDEIVGIYEKLFTNLLKQYSDIGALAIFLKTLLMRNPEIVEKINLDLFDDARVLNPDDVNYRQLKLAKQMRMSPDGSELIAMMTQLRSDRKVVPRCKY